MQVLIGIIAVLFMIQDEDPVSEAREYLRTDYQRAVEVSTDILENDENNIDALWIKSVAYSNIANFEAADDEFEELFEKADALADRALEINNDYADAHYAKAVALGRRAEMAGAREGVRLSREIKSHADTTLELDPEHGGAWYINGMLLYRVANLTRTERFAANALFGGFPFEASNEKAIDALKNSIKYSPDHIYYHLGLARALITDDQTDEARRVLQKARDLEPVRPQDPEHLQTVEDKLRDL